MRCVLLLAAVGSLLWNPAAAQMDEILLFSDANYTDCTLVDKSPGEVSVYVVHRVGGGRAGSQFQVLADDGVGLMYLGESSPYAIVIGSTQTGISVSYGECPYSDVLVATINYFTAGTSSTCSTLRVVPDPNSLTGTIEIATCDLNKLEASGSRMVVNSDGSCDCGSNTQLLNWGKIKSKYDD